MSSLSSPAHRFSGDYDATVYDHNFTADISNKMRVPSKILVTGEGKNNAVDLFPTKVSLEAEMWEKINNMQVPDRIVMAGHDQHYGLRAPPRELRLENITTPQPGLIRVETPPRVLTLEDHFFPTVDDDDDAFVDEEKHEKDDGQAEKRGRRRPLEKLEEQSIPGGAETPPGVMSSEMIASPMEQVLTLRRQMSKLNRRVILLEQESQLRQQRESANAATKQLKGAVRTALQNTE